VDEKLWIMVTTGVDTRRLQVGGRKSNWLEMTYSSPGEGK
jgi:hypothetical protein